MRKLTVILFALLGVVFFNSCKDETTDEKPQATDTGILNELKGYAGKTYEEISVTILSKGFTLTDSNVGEGFGFYTFSNSDATITYDFFKYENKMCMMSYSLYNDNRDVLLSNFEKYSLSAIAFIGNTSSIYEGEIELLDSMEGGEEFENRTDFLAAYNQNKPNIAYCYEDWTTQDYIIGSEFDYAEGDEYENYSLIGYADVSLLPPMFDKSNKSIFEILHKKRR
ncbi:MAG: hypothetical protein WC135_07595 [Bacteroidales bacterium]